jgi:hypothetical protein
MSTVPGTHFHQPDAIQSWGRVPRSHHIARRPASRDEAVDSLPEGSGHRNGVPAIGPGRSYGNRGLNPNGAVVVTTARLANCVCPELQAVTSGIGNFPRSLAAVLLPLVFLLPATPGTRHVTLGRPVANDVRRKSHYGARRFGRWVARWAWCG